MHKIKRLDFTVKNAVQSAADRQFQIMRLRDFIHVFTGDSAFRKISDF